MSELEQVTQYYQSIVVSWIGCLFTLVASALLGQQPFLVYFCYTIGIGLLIFGNILTSKSSLKKLANKERIAIIKKFKPPTLSSMLVFLVTIAAAFAMYKSTYFSTWLLVVNIFSIFFFLSTSSQYIHLSRVRINQ